MNYEELISVVLECNKMVNSYGILPFDVAEKCLRATELLREIVADGDFNKYREWYAENIPPQT